MTVYSSNTSLILTDLLTSGQNYSFAVAVTDSTGQHGPWSDQLMVTYHGRYIQFCDFTMISVNTVPGIVSFTIQVQLTNIFITWNVRLVMCVLMSFTALFQPPPLIEYFPVLHYVVSYNTSDNSTVIQTQLSSSISSYTVSSEAVTMVSDKES